MNTAGMTDIVAPMATAQRTFGPLPAEVFLHVLDQLVHTCDGHRPVARPPSDAVTKTLRSLTLVSRRAYLIATEYLYSNCVWLGCPTTFARFCATLALNRQHQTLADDTVPQENKGFATFDLSRCITSIYISPLDTKSVNGNRWKPPVGLPAIVDLCNTIGGALRRLHLNSTPIVTLFSSMKKAGLDDIDRNMFSRMLHLEELMISQGVIGYFLYPPPNLKRLAVAADFFTDAEAAFCLSPVSLQTLVLFRPLELTANDIEIFFGSYHGNSLDVILVDKNFDHWTPVGTREWKSDDKVRIWEADVPVSFYGDDDSSELCEQWMWSQGMAGTLWSQTQRRMTSWPEIERRLAGPIHSIVA